MGDELAPRLGTRKVDRVDRRTPPQQGAQRANLRGRTEHHELLTHQIDEVRALDEPVERVRR